jgi:hypothetical protein
MNSSVNKKGKQKRDKLYFWVIFFKAKLNTFVILCDHIRGTPLNKS